MARNGYICSGNILFSYCNICYILWRINLICILIILGEERKLLSGMWHVVSSILGLFHSVGSIVSIIVVFLIFVIYVLSPWSYTAAFNLVSCDFLQKIIEKAVPENTPTGKCTWPLAFPGPKIMLLCCCLYSLWTAVSTLLLCMKFLPPR